MSLIKTYSTAPRLTSDFGATKTEAQQNKVTKISSLKEEGNVIVPGYEVPYDDPSLSFLKTAAHGYSDIYGNQTKYWEAIYK